MTAPDLDLKAIEKLANGLLDEHGTCECYHCVAHRGLLALARAALRYREASKDIAFWSDNAQSIYPTDPVVLMDYARAALDAEQEGGKS